MRQITASCETGHMPSSAACDPGHRNSNEFVRRANLKLENRQKIRNVSVYLRSMARYCAVVQEASRTASIFGEHSQSLLT